MAFPWDNGVYEGTVSPEDLVFPRMIIHGVLENLPAIDEEISRHLDHWDIHRLARVDLAILRMATYCLLHTADIPRQVTIDEAVELAKELGAEGSYRFVNGVLDSIGRTEDPREGSSS